MDGGIENIAKIFLRSLVLYMYDVGFQNGRGSCMNERTIPFNSKAWCYTYTSYLGLFHGVQHFFVSLSNVRNQTIIDRFFLKVKCRFCVIFLMIFFLLNKSLILAQIDCYVDNSQHSYPESIAVLT